MNGRSGSAPPLLVLEDVVRDPDVPGRLAGVVRAGGHQLRIVLDFPRGDPRFAEHVEMPWLLSLHPSSQRAVVLAMARIDAGEAVSLPHDLSADVRRAEEPCPWQPLSEASRAALDAAADRISVRVQHAERSGTDPLRVNALLELDG